MQFLSLAARFSNALISPRLGSTSHLQALRQSSESGPLPFVLFPGTGGQQGLLPTALIAPRNATCLMMGCNSTRIRKDCGRRMCKAYCCEAGGCADPAHKMLQATATSFVAPAPPTTTSANIASTYISRSSPTQRIFYASKLY